MDAAIELLAASGVHGLTHRAVEKAADLPQGTASNYFRSREALLVAAAERIVELHHADMDEIGRRHTDTATPPPDVTEHITEHVTEHIAEHIADLLAASLLEAATTLRTRYLAIFELQLEAARRPALASALAALQDTSIHLTAGHHADLDLPIPPEKIPTLITLYGGALFTLVTAPPGHISMQTVHGIAEAIVRGTLTPAEG